jgi:hypothetical protein
VPLAKMAKARWNPWRPGTGAPSGPMTWQPVAHQRAPGARASRGELRLGLARLPQVVGSRQRHPLAPASPIPPFRAAATPAFSWRMYRTARASPHHGLGVIRRPIIYNDHLQGRVSLMEDRPYSLRERFTVIVRGDDNATPVMISQIFKGMTRCSTDRQPLDNHSNVEPWKDGTNQWLGTGGIHLAHRMTFFSWTIHNPGG